MTGLHQQWATYLSTHPLAQQLWDKIIAVAPLTKIPAAMPLEDYADGAVFQFAWDDGPHHLDIDLMKDGTMEWFYCNRKTNAVDGNEGSDGTDNELREYLRLFEEKIQ